MYIVIGGGGKVGEALARRLLKAGHEVAVIERHPERVTRLANTLSGRVMVVCGNCCDAQYLMEAGIEHADLLCAVTGQDDNNLAGCEVAQALFKVPRALARINNPRNERIFNSLGISSISSTSVISQMFVEEIARSRSRTTVALKHGEFTVIEMELPNSSALKAEGGMRAADLDLPDGASILAVLRGDRYEKASDQTVLQPGDTVVLCGTSDIVDDARHALLEL